MDQTRLDALLTDVSRGVVSPHEAAQQLARLPVADLGFARLDLHRELRTGLCEVIYCPGKTVEQVRAIATEMLKHPGGALLATRATPEQADAVRRLTDDVHVDDASGTIVLRASASAPLGSAVVVTAGTADLPIAREALVTADAIGIKTDLIADVGVAGLHRTLAVQDDLRAADVVIVVAGMEGALPSVVAGMVAAPVIAVPTSVGYGASFAGLSALLTMMNSCAPGIAVVNIDNGFGAAVLAGRILASR